MEIEIKKEESLCDWPGCKQHSQPGCSIHGNAYCQDHHSPALEKHFLAAYDRWDGHDKPDGKLLNLFSRYIEDIYNNGDVPGGLSKGRLNYRIEKMRKTKKGLNFSIRRHRNAWRHPERMHSVIQRWSFDIQHKRLKLLKEVW